QTKLIRVISGKILDVALDIRPDSKTFGEHFAVELSENNFLQLLIPRGFAHGYCVLSESAIITYKCDNYYDPKSEGGVIYNDPDLAIDWGLTNNEITLSEKDKIHPHLKDLVQS
ncbi:MAG: dTDP-4-dehydrorhamnose 3,5-epimerase family protein, partial [Bdellovibrionales bacterium]|nr:dTDP-4-dehydrorhamnose 3,5-epimerase family protein [Bdellovibrionales bacterium]